MPWLAYSGSQVALERGVEAASHREPWTGAEPRGKSRIGKIKVNRYGEVPQNNRHPLEAHLVISDSQRPEQRWMNCQMKDSQEPTSHCMLSYLFLEKNLKGPVCPWRAGKWAQF